MSRSIASLILWLAVCALTSLAHASSGPDPSDGPWLQYADPTLAGLDPAKLNLVRQRADELNTGALVVVRGGHVVAAWGDIERKFKSHSMRKSFLSALFGPAVATGDINLSGTLADLGVDDIQPLSVIEKQATVEHVIQSRSGIYHRAAKEPRSVNEHRPARGTKAPGEAFWYNNWDFNTAGRIYEEATEQSIFEGFRDQLATPLGMQDFSIDDTFYQYERNLSRMPGYAIRLSARDATRFGQLYLREGSWSGKQLVPAEWIKRSWSAHSRLDENRAYGYMWWIYEPGFDAEQPELAAYAASGTGGQLIAIVPGLDMVIVHRADTDFGGGVRGGDVWKLVGDIAGAVVGDVLPDPELEAVKAIPFSKTLPPLETHKVISLSAAELDLYVGEYAVGDRAQISLRRLDDVLVGTMSGLGEADFFPVGDHRFWGRAARTTIQFELNANGAVARMLIRLRGQDMVAEPRR